MEKGFTFNEGNLKEIIENFRYISDIRNKFLHGHPVTQTSSDEEIIQSTAKQILNRNSFNNVREKANTIAQYWNNLITELQSQESIINQSDLPSKSFFDNCRFEVF